MSDADDRLIKFESGEAIEVPVERIEQELAELWRRAAEARTRPGERVASPVTRACLWNLIVRATGEHFRAAKRLIDEVSESVPARVILLHSETGAVGPEAAMVDRPIRAWVEANW